MGIEGLVQIPETGLVRFSGLNTLENATNLPLFASPDNQDVEFLPGLVRTRPGLTSLANPLGATDKLNGLAGFTWPDNVTKRMLEFSDAGALSSVTQTSDSVQSAVTQLAASIAAARMNAAVLFTRAFIAIGDGKQGVFPPGIVSPTDMANIARASRDGPYRDSGGFQAAENVTAGGIVAGVHKVVYFFQFSTGYRTRPMPVGATWTATGGKTVDITTIAIGPSGVVKRIVAVTSAGGSTYWFIPQSRMEISSAAPSLIALDFTDTALLQGENIDALFKRISIPEVSGAFAYASRMVLWGARNDYGYRSRQNPIQALPNLGFDGGFSGASTQIPTDWILVGVEPSGLSRESTLVVGGLNFGFALRITGDGVSATRGHLKQAGFDPTQVFPADKTFRVRAWVRRSAGLVAGTLKISIQGLGTVGLAVTAAQATVAYQPFEADLFLSSDVVPTASFVLDLIVDGTPTNGEYFLVDEITIFPSGAPYLGSTLLVTKAEDMETVDGITGLITVARDNGQDIRAVFNLREFLFIAKERSLYVTADDGINEPSGWTLREVSSTVGTPSARGVGLGDGWAVIASRQGLYLFSGGTIDEGNKLSLEIQPTWDTINWQFGHLIEVRIDTKRKRIYVAAPFGAATEPNRILVLDYDEGFGDPLGQDGFGRKWTTWQIASSALAMIERADGTSQLWIGNNVGNGKVYRLNDAATSDDGTAINSYWQSGYFQDGARLLFGYLTANMSGIGVATVTLLAGDQTGGRTVRGWSLKSDALRNFERQINRVRERMAVKVGTNLAGHNFSLQGMGMWIRPSPWSRVRGVNS